ncbi:MAG: glycosyltransferase family 39 protein, partial [Prolixibacteraceae bacterium]
MIINRTFWLITILLLLVVTGLSLDLPMVVNAAKYAQVSREILDNGDWINLTIAGDPYDQKPPLMFWIGALFFSILGVSTPVWKLSLLLVSGVGIYSTYRLGKLLYDETTGRLAALFWATSLGFLYFHNDIHIDTLLADTITFSIWQLAAFFKSKKPAHFYLGMAGAGLSMLAKGPVGLAIPAFSTGFHLIMHKKWKEILHPRWIAGTLIIAILIIPALVGLLNQFGP